jgi:hypothetical protein
MVTERGHCACIPDAITEGGVQVRARCVNFLRTPFRLALNTSSHREEYRDLEDANYHTR